MPIFQNNLWGRGAKVGASDIIAYISHASGSMMRSFVYQYPNPMSKCRSWIDKYGTVFATESITGRKDNGKNLNLIFGADASTDRYIRRAYASKATNSQASIKFHSMLKSGDYRLHYSAEGFTGGGG